MYRFGPALRRKCNTSPSTGGDAPLSHAHADRRPGRVLEATEEVLQLLMALLVVRDLGLPPASTESGA